VVGIDGLSPVLFNAAPGSYHVAVRHRNHLGAMSAAPLTLGILPVTLDLRDSATPTWGTDARKQMGANMVLYCGNVRRDLPLNTIKYTGAANDRDPVLNAIGGLMPTATVTGYMVEDVNLSGVVKYTGTANDRDPILVNIGGVVPTNTRTEQLP
jgi:hypothetical protein